MRNSIIPAILRLPILALFGLTGAAQAQNEASPLIPNLNGFSLPSARPNSEPPVVAPTPTPIPAAPEPTPTSTPRASTPRATPTPRSMPSPEPRPAAVAIPTATPTPTTTPVVEATPIPALTPTAAAPIPVAEAQPAAPNSTWVWLSLGVLALAGLLFALFRLRSLPRRDPLDQSGTIDIGRDEVEAAPAPAAAPATPPLPQAAPLSRARIDVTMRPVRAGTNLTSGAVDYEIGLRNSGDVPATDVRVDIRLMNASADQAAMLKLLFAQSIEKPLVDRFDLSPGQAITLGGMAMIPQEGIVPVSIAGRDFFVPMFSVNVLYGWHGDGQGQTAAAWVVGIERAPGEKMVPFRLDAGPRMYDAVGQRPQGFAITR